MHRTGTLGSVALAASMLVFAGAAVAGELSGTVKLTGKPPKPEALVMKSDPFCSKQPTQMDQTILAGKGGGLGNVVVRIAKGLAKPPAAPKTPAIMDQKGCIYDPRVVVAQAGQPVEIRNSDATLHNVHTYKGAATLFNRPHIQGMPPFQKVFPTVGDVIKFKCDVHPWMTGYVLISDNPFHAVSDPSGAFTIKDIPAGKYTVEIWHEKLGTQTKEVTIAEGKPAKLHLSFKAP